MNPILPESIIADLVAEKPSRSRAFEEMGLDYCCGGKRSLAKACEKKGLSVDLLIRKIRETDTVSPDVELDQLADSTLAELIDHILAAHHDYLKTNLPHLETLVDRVAVRHGESDPRLVELAKVYAEFRAEIESHMMKEEEMLFPEIRAVEATDPAERVVGNSMGIKISMMEQEHDQAGLALERFSSLTDNFAPSDEHCTKHRALLVGLKELIKNTHQHISKENNLLFPKAIAMETGA